MEQENSVLAMRIVELTAQVSSLQHSVNELCGVIFEYRGCQERSLLTAMFNTAARHKARLSTMQPLAAQPELPSVTAERNALAAAVEALRSEIQTPYVCRFSREEKLSAILTATPQQHLRDIRAEAGRAGFIAGFVAGDNFAMRSERGFYSINQIKEKAEQSSNNYAERVKAGEK